MRRFVFRLQPLLDWRRRLEDEKRREFAACRLALAECDAECERLAGARAASLNARDLRLRDAYLRYLDGEGEALRAGRAELELACDRAREELAAATRERSVIEKLKERRRRVYEAQEARRDELELDDANARLHERALRERIACGAPERALP